MNDILQHQFIGLGENIIGYLPNLFAGIVLIAAGWFLGWIAKRVTIQLAGIFRVGSYFAGFRWGKDFSKADVRYGFYNFLGNIAFIVVFLIFLGNAFNAWKLKIMSKLMEDTIYFIPRTFASLVTFGVGWLIAIWASRAVESALHRENIPKATLIGSFVKAVLMIFFFAMALVELNIARQIVIIGFATIFGTLGLLTIIIVALGGKEFVQKILQSFKGE